MIRPCTLFRTRDGNGKPCQAKALEARLRCGDQRKPRRSVAETLLLGAPCSVQPDLPCPIGLRGSQIRATRFLRQDVPKKSSLNCR